LTDFDTAALGIQDPYGSKRGKAERLLFFQQLTNDVNVALVRRSEPVDTSQYARSHPRFGPGFLPCLMQLTGTANGSILNPTVTAEPLSAFRASVAPAMELTQEQ
jgi:hypothetical protein